MNLSACTRRTGALAHWTLAAATAQAADIAGLFQTAQDAAVHIPDAKVRATFVQTAQTAPAGALISLSTGGLVAAGGGHLVAAGGGTLVAAGGGNLVAAGGGH